jgi:Ca2+-binding EF-hand superfamily protein
MLTVFRYFFNDFTTIQGINIFEGIQIAYGAFGETFVCLWFFMVSIGVFNVISAIFVERTLAAASALEKKRMTLRLQDKQKWMRNVKILIRELYMERIENLEKENPDKDFFDVVEQIAHENVDHVQFDRFIRDADVLEALEDLEIDAADHRGLFEILDADNTGSITLVEFLDGLRRLRGFPRRSDTICIDLMVREMQCQIHLLVEGVDNLISGVSKISDRVGVGSDEPETE